MMMAGKATGKGLNVKGKSAKRGVLSGYVPFLQISDEAHKSKMGTSPACGRPRGPTQPAAPARCRGAINHAAVPRG